MELDYTVKPRFTRRINPRLILFIVVCCVPFAFFLYIFINQIVTGGIQYHGNYAEVDLKSMGNFPFDDQNGLLTDVPKNFRELDGKRVELKGMMWDLQSAGPQTRQFQLVYNIQKCCFGGPPRVQERVFVHTKNGSNVTFHDQLMDAVGILHVRLKRNAEGTIVSVYDMDLESLKPA